MTKLIKTEKWYLSSYDTESNTIYYSDNLTLMHELRHRYQFSQYGNIIKLLLNYSMVLTVASIIGQIKILQYLFFSLYICILLILEIDAWYYAFYTLMKYGRPDIRIIKKELKRL